MNLLVGVSQLIRRIFVERLFLTFLTIALLMLATGEEIAPQHAYAFTSDSAAVLTYKNDTFHTGLNEHETILNTSNVNQNQFGKRMAYPVDGQVYAQPLYMPDLFVNGGIHNVVFVATEHDSMYAFDADQKNSLSPLWHTSFIDPPAVTTVSVKDVGGCNDISPEYGITGTPVIDPITRTLYVVANTKESDGTIVYRLHKLDLATGAEEPGSPTLITAKVPGTGAGSVDGSVTFEPSRQLQRAALLLLNGMVYVAFGSHCDIAPYHGWIMSYNAATLQQISVYNDTPNGTQGGIWQSGASLAADYNGNIYVATGNGTFDLNEGGKDAGDSILKFSTPGGKLILTDYFTPFNQQCLEARDADLGSGGLLLPPYTNELIEAGKEGRIYVVDRADMGEYTQIANPCQNQQRTDIDKVLQEIRAFGPLFSPPASWNSFVYFGAHDSPLEAFQLRGGRLSTSPIAQSPEVFKSGGNPVISSNGIQNGTGIVWVIDPAATLRAYDAANVATELYNSDQNPDRDTLGSFVKFSVPTVVNGQVFVGTQDSLVIYGLLNAAG
jgi:hypothetical protein